MASWPTLSSTCRSCWPVTQFLILEQTSKSSPVNLFLSIKIQLRLLIENNARISSPACENSRLSLLLGARDVAPGETSARQQQEFHTDDEDQCLHNISGSREVLSVNLFDFLFILDDYGKVLCFSVNKQNANVSSNKEEYIPRILTLL